MALSPRQHVRFWLLAAAVFGVLVWGLRDILAPFISGMVIGYLLDPIVNRMERRRIPRWLATTGVLGSFLVAMTVAIILLVPVLSAQTVALFTNLPQYVATVQQQIAGWAEEVLSRYSEQHRQGLMAAADRAVGQLYEWAESLVASLVSTTVGMFELISFLLITPVVAFYMLRDWDRFLLQVDILLPRPYAGTIRSLARRVDETLAGFVRGQLTVCLLLGTFYAVLLSLVGLNYGFVIGMGAGLLSFIPYVGSIVGFGASVGVALLQFDEASSVILVGVVFVLGQFIEGNILTPKLVGERVGLPAVWVIFALMAGGHLLGFVGLLLGVPVAAIIGVLIRFAVERYRASHYYHHGLEDDWEEVTGPPTLQKQPPSGDAPPPPAVKIIRNPTRGGDIP